uniref:Deoxyhypusine synthase n=1 Tax=Rhabditophanes sp. KR3021 TaxID=114890 RepID=A0AC35TUS5_9BILA
MESMPRSNQPADLNLGDAHNFNGICDDLEMARAAVLMEEAAPFQHDNIEIKGYDFNNGVDYSAILDSYMTVGFQASHLGKAINQINEMIRIREEPVNLDEHTDAFFPYPVGKKRKSLTLFLGYTSNLISSGLRDIFKFLAQHDMIDCIVTSAGGVEEDIIKALSPSFLGEFSMDGQSLRDSGMNRAGNILIPNGNYCTFEEWIMPVLDECAEEKINWTPSKLINRLGKKINNPSSIYYWCWRNKIPVFCPGITDGSLGDMLYFHSVTHPNGGLKIDVVEDIKHINTMAIRSHKTGCVILGGGIVKHHINNANLFRNGSDFSVYINTGIEDDGSDSGARPDEAISWGKIKGSAKPVKVFSDATLVFPLVVAKTFAKDFKGEKEAYFDAKEGEEVAGEPEDFLNDTAIHLGTEDYKAECIQNFEIMKIGETMSSGVTSPDMLRQTYNRSVEGTGYCSSDITSPDLLDTKENEGGPNSLGDPKPGNKL